MISVRSVVRFDVGLRGGCNSMVEYQVVVLRVEGSTPSLRPLIYLICIGEVAQW